jgi:hypothetical protein
VTRPAGQRSMDRHPKSTAAPAPQVTTVRGGAKPPPHGARPRGQMCPIGTVPPGRPSAFGPARFRYRPLPCTHGGPCFAENRLESRAIVPLHAPIAGVASLTFVAFSGAAVLWARPCAGPATGSSSGLEPAPARRTRDLFVGSDKQ